MYQRVGTAAFKKDLSNIIFLCNHLGNPQNKFKSVHVAGTNGKGSSSHMIAAVLQESGYKTGLYTSPHLKRFTERIKINGSEIPEEDVIYFVDIIYQQILEIKPSFFEITVALAFWYFAKESIDIAVVEVGLGGRLDSTNILTPDVALITNISMDHTDMLGDSLPEIAAEKAGIIKQGIPVVIGEKNDNYDYVFQRIAAEKKSVLIHSENEFICHRDGVIEKISGNLIDLSFNNWPQDQLLNIPGVMSVLELLNKSGFTISKEAKKSGIEKFKEITRFKGRWQKLKNTPLTYCDTGHNIDGIKAIMDEISKYSYNKLHIVWGMVKDKDIKSMLELLPANAHYYFCKPDIPRGQDAEIVHQIAKTLGFKGVVIDDVNDAYQKAISCARDEDFIFIGGSTFVVAELEDI